MMAANAIVRHARANPVSASWFRRLSEFSDAPNNEPKVLPGKKLVVPCRHRRGDYVNYERLDGYGGTRHAPERAFAGKRQYRGIMDPDCVIV